MKVRAQVKIDKISMEYNREGFQEYINRDLKMSWSKEALKHLKVETSTVNDDNMRFEEKTITAGVFSIDEMNSFLKLLNDLSLTNLKQCQRDMVQDLILKLNT